jgi:hypothetical protein
VGRPPSEKKKETRKLGQFLQWNGKERKIWDTIMPFRLRLERTQKIIVFRRATKRKIQGMRYIAHKREGEEKVISQGHHLLRHEQGERRGNFCQTIKSGSPCYYRKRGKKKIRQRMMKGVGLARLYHGWRRKGYKKKHKNKESPL